MMGMQFTGKLLLLLLFTCLASTAKVHITCNAPSVVEGQPATVTCHFKRDVRALSSASVTVEHYAYGSADPVPVLECTPVGNDCKLPIPGYTFDNQINTILVLQITSASTKNNGRYACKMLSPDLAETDEVDPCDFTVSESPTTSTSTATPIIITEPPNKADTHIAVIVGAIAAVIVIAVVIVFFIRRKKRLCFSPGSPATSDDVRNRDDNNASNAVKSQTTPLIHRQSSSITPADEERQEDGRASETGNEGDTLLEEEETNKQRDTPVASAVKPEITVAGGSDGNDLVSGDTDSHTKDERPEHAIGDDGSSDPVKKTLEDGESGVSSVDSPRRQNDEKDDTIPEDTVGTPRPPETVTEKDGSSEETQQEQGVDESKSPGVGQLTKHFEKT